MQIDSGNLIMMQLARVVVQDVDKLYLTITGFQWHWMSTVYATFSEKFQLCYYAKEFIISLSIKCPRIVLQVLFHGFKFM